MLSRIADSLFWLNRYMERGDGLLRSVKTQYILLLDKGINENLSWEPLLETYCGGHEIGAIKDNTEAALQKLLLDIANPNSLRVIINRARENARGVQDHITKEVWEQVNHMYHSVNGLSPAFELKGYEAIGTIDALTNSCILYNGVADTTMPRGLGWSFMSMGRYIERCMLTLEMTGKYFGYVDYDLEDDKDILQWRPLLLSLSGYELHLKTYRNTRHTANTWHQVIFNEHFTRSVLYTLKRMNKYYQDIVKDNPSDEVKALSRHLGRLISMVEYKDFDSFNKATLQPFIKALNEELNAFSSKFAQHFFSYT